MEIKKINSNKWEYKVANKIYDVTIGYGIEHFFKDEITDALIEIILRGRQQTETEFPRDYTFDENDLFEFKIAKNQLKQNK